jgi:ring-1,2-phenylacetyl-CoA epoxidase subunit PaaE
LFLSGITYLAVKSRYAMIQNDPLIKRVQIVEIKQETTASSTFELQPLDGWEPDYQAGQFITLVFTDEHKEERRSYSFSSAPVLHEPMRITIKRVTNGEYSRFLLDHAKPGDVLLTSGISGFFQLPPAEKLGAAQRLFFLAAGSGITPVYALIKTALVTTTLPITLIYSNKSVADTIFYHELQQLQQLYPDRLQVEFLFSDVLNIRKSRLSNWLLLQLLQELLTIPLQQCLFYLCGPFDYMQMITITLLTEGVPPANIKKENFSTLKPVKKPKPPDTDAHQVKVRIHDRTYEVTVQYPHSILAAAREQGIVLPYSCEAGRCGSCAATCTKGQVWMAYNEVLMDDEISKGRVLTCQGYPVGGDAEIEL